MRRFNSAGEPTTEKGSFTINSPTQVVSIRLPSKLLNQLKAYASARDLPYRALITLLLAESLQRRRAA